MGKNAIFSSALAWSSRKVFLSRDAGGSWSNVTGNLPIGSPDVPSLDSRLITKATVSGDALLVSLYSNPATPNGPFTFRSTNDGANWQAANSGLEGPSSINKFVADKDTLYSLTAFHTHSSNSRWRSHHPSVPILAQGMGCLLHATRQRGVPRDLVNRAWPDWVCRTGVAGRG
jgi:hypothetical protein